LEGPSPSPREVLKNKPLTRSIGKFFITPKQKTSTIEEKKKQSEITVE
jgi:hypothetical protein